MKLFSSIFVLAIAFVFLTSCATSSKKLARVSLGMTKSEVVNHLGDPQMIRGSIKNKFNQVVEVWQYRVALPDDGGEIARKSALTLVTFGIGAYSFADKDKENYWFYFHNNELVRWGVAWDWEREADKIIDINFNQGPKLRR